MSAEREKTLISHRARCFRQTDFLPALIEGCVWRLWPFIHWPFLAEAINVPPYCDFNILLVAHRPIRAWRVRLSVRARKPAQVRKPKDVC